MESMREFSDRIVDALESGDIPWHAAAAGMGLSRRFDGQAFDGASVIALWMTGTEKGFERPTWLGRERIDEMGGRLKAGATPGTAFLRVRRPCRLPGPEGGFATTEAWRPRDVWCVDEVDGLPDHLYRRAEEFLVPPATEEELWDHVELEEGYGYERLYAVINEITGEERRGAATDMTVREAARAFVRWTASPARMNRDGAGVEESLVVDIGSAFLLAEFGVVDYPEGSGSWRTEEWWGAMAQAAGRIREDDEVVFRAGQHASDAVEWVWHKSHGYGTFSVLASRGAFDPEYWEWMEGAAGGRWSRPAPSLPAAARRITADALDFLARPVAVDDNGAWRGLANHLVREVAGLDLDVPGVREAVGAEGALWAEDGVVFSAETFVADFVEGTRRRLAMGDLTTQHTRAMSLGESAQRI